MIELFGLLGLVGFGLLVLGPLFIFSKIRRGRGRNFSFQTAQTPSQENTFWYRTKKGDLRQARVIGKHKGQLVVEFPEHHHWCIIPPYALVVRRRWHNPGAS